MAKPLTKSRFKLGSVCPTKLFYAARPEYGNSSDQDEFLRALSEGGFQVGELAKVYFPGGVMVESLDYDESVSRTNELLQKDEVTIFEAAVRKGDLFVRVDILRKHRAELELIEVKAKSFASAEENFADIFDKRALKKGAYVLKAEWEKYLLDLAFQTYVLRQAFPQAKIVSKLMLADKSTRASVDGLNQLFLIARDQDGRSRIKVSERALLANVGQSILTAVDLTKQVNLIIERGQVQFGPTFKQLVENLVKWQSSSERCPPPIEAQCKSCEFRIAKAKFPSGTKAGFEECWSLTKKLTPDELQRPFVFDVWDYRRTSASLEKGFIFAKDLDEVEIGLKEREDGEFGMSRTERQMYQIKAARELSPNVFINREGLAAELKTLPTPFHFIDFETTMVAIPFHKGRRPYEQIAFQFSHHIMHKDSSVEHRTEYINVERGLFPNFDFARNLKTALSHDRGTVLRFAAHENTVLCQIRDQLALSSEPDKDELMKWIESIASPPERRAGEWFPVRKFVDMRDLVLKYMYLPETKGSNSIKKVLPALLNLNTEFFKMKYPEWIKIDSTGKVTDPYKILPPVFSDVDPALLERSDEWLSNKRQLDDGGAAMMAWARMQFSEMSDVERDALRNALLRYCKLDTLAMVMIWEWWLQEIAKVGVKVA